MRATATPVRPARLTRVRPRALTLRGVLSVALPAAPVVILLQRAWVLRFASDDGYITLRVARQLLDGNGPVYNVGERVEASTSTLWVYVLAVGDLLLPLRLPRVAIFLGLLLSAGGVVFALLAARRLLHRSGAGALLVPAGLLVLVAVKPVWIYTTSGLEGGLITGWLGISLWILVRWTDGGRLPAWAAVVLGLGPLVRPDVGLYTALFLLVLVVDGRGRWREVAGTLAWALALPVAYQVFRMGYYGQLVPNPAVAKEAGTSRWDLGWTYVRNFVDPYALHLPLLVLAGGAYVPLVRDLRRDGRARALLVVGAFVAAGLLHALYVVRVGGDWLESRLLLPAFFALLAPIGLVPLRRSYVVALLVVPWSVVSMLFFRSDVDEKISANRNLVLVGDYGWGTKSSWRLAPYRHDGVWYHGHHVATEAIGHDVVYGAFGIGVSGYALEDLYVLDMLGLADPFTAHLEINRRVLPGHEKPLPLPWFVARTVPEDQPIRERLFPTFPVVGSYPLGDPGDQTFVRRVAIARSTLECRGLRDFMDAYTEPLTVGRFFSNVVHAFDNTTKRIPPEPRDAAAELCDD
jgi:arabinofuranosyltransferase